MEQWVGHKLLTEAIMQLYLTGAKSLETYVTTHDEVLVCEQCLSKLHTNSKKEAKQHQPLPK
jgi:hypothetical protein